MFTVQWDEDELDRLADVVVVSDLPTRDEIVAAVERINARLAADPMAEGESRGSNRVRFTYLGRVSVLFAVDLTDRVVRVFRFTVS